MDTMYKQLHQKKVFIKREATIMENKVVYNSGMFGRRYEVSLPYEDLSRSKDAHFLNRAVFYVPVLILGFITAVSYSVRNDESFQNDLGGYQWIFIGFMLLISLVIYVISIETLWKIRVQDNTYLFFFRNIPNRKEVDDFIECLFKTRDKYLRETYFFEPTKNLSFESQKNTLQWLRKAEVITGTG